MTRMGRDKTTRLVDYKTGGRDKLLSPALSFRGMRGRRFSDTPLRPADKPPIRAIREIRGNPAVLIFFLGENLGSRLAPCALRLARLVS